MEKTYICEDCYFKSDKQRICCGKKMVNVKHTTKIASNFCGCQKIFLIGLIATLFLISACDNNTSIVSVNDMDGDFIADEGNNELINDFNGKILAGTTSHYIEFTQADYEKALSENKIIFLDFYANWCPICKLESPSIKSAFNELENENVIGFRVNYNDDETSEEEELLAKEFGITYQHTKVILKDGEEVTKSLETWNKERVLEEISKAV